MSNWLASSDLLSSLVISISIILEEFGSGSLEVLEKNDLYFLGTTLGFRLDLCTFDKTFHLIGAPFRIIGARMSMSLTDVSPLFPCMVLHCEMSAVSTIFLRVLQFDLYTARLVSVSR